MMLRIGPILIVTCNSLHAAVERFGRQHGSIKADGIIENEFMPFFAGVALFINALFDVGAMQVKKKR